MNKAKVILFLTYFFILRPSPTALLGSTLALKLFDALSMLIVLIVIPSLLREHNKVMIGYNKNFFLVLLLILSSLLSMFISAIFLNFNSSWIDLGSIYKYVFYFLLLLVGYMGSKYLSVERLIKHLALATIVTVFISILQYYNPFNINEIIRLVYTDEKLKTLSTGNPRVFGTLYNSNWYAVYLAFTFTVLFSFYLKGALKRSTKTIIITALLMELIGLLFSGSRTGLIIVTLGTITVLFLSFIDRPRFKVIVLPTLIIGFILLMFSNIELNNKRYEELFNAFKSSDTAISDVNSMSGRLNTMEKALTYSYENPITGIGFFENLNINTHNSFITVYIQQGIVGITILLVFFTNYIIKFIINFSRINNKTVKYFYIGITAGIVTMLVAFATGQYFYAVQIMSIFFLYVGFCYGFTENRLDKSRERKIQRAASTSKVFE